MVLVRSVRGSSDGGPQLTSTEDLGNLESYDRLCGEEDRREASNQKQASNHCVPIPNFLRNVAVDKQTNDLATVCSIAQTGLPKKLPLVWYVV